MPAIVIHPCHCDLSRAAAAEYLPKAFINSNTAAHSGALSDMEATERIASDGGPEADHLCVLIHGFAASRLDRVALS